jgi:hypothetical protein
VNITVAPLKNVCCKAKGNSSFLNLNLFNVEKVIYFWKTVENGNFNNLVQIIL